MIGVPMAEQEQERGPADTAAAHLEDNNDDANEPSPTDGDELVPSRRREEANTPADNAVVPADRSPEPGNRDRPLALDPVEYFEVKNPTVDRSIKHNSIHTEATYQAASDRYEKVAELLESMGCVVSTDPDG